MVTRRPRPRCGIHMVTTVRPSWPGRRRSCSSPDTTTTRTHEFLTTCGASDEPLEIALPQLALAETDVVGRRGDRHGSFDFDDHDPTDALARLDGSASLVELDA